MKRPAGRFVAALITVPRGEAAASLARSLVEERLAACVNRIGPVHAVFRWKGAVESDEEELLLVKTRRDLLGDIEAHLEAHHPYDLPELIALPLTAGSTAYLAWLDESVGKP